MSPKTVYIKNSILLGVAIAYSVFCRVFSLPMITDPCSDRRVPSPSHDILVYLKENFAFVLFFLLFVVLAATSFMLAYLIYHKFDRNRDAARTSVYAGILFICVAIYIIMGTNALDVFRGHIAVFDFLSSLALFFMVPAFFAYITTKHVKKWMVVTDWCFSALVLLVLTLGFMQVDIHIIHWLMSFYIMAFLAVMTVFSFLNLRSMLLKKYRTKALRMIACTLQFISLLAAQYFYVTKGLFFFWLCFSAAMGLTAYLIFGDLVETAARQYVKTADAENYRKMAYVDALCNINNRNAFMMEQNNTFDSDSLYYVVFDVNNLKRINDMFGHSEGDVIIRRAANVIAESFRDIGKCYRIGGDEFAVIGQYKTAEEIRACLRQMRAEIDAYNGTSAAKLDIAYGYAIRDNTAINTYELFNKADKAMYRYKKRMKAQARSA